MVDNPLSDELNKEQKILQIVRQELPSPIRGLVLALSASPPRWPRKGGTTVAVPKGPWPRAAYSLHQLCPTFEIGAIKKFVIRPSQGCSCQDISENKCFHAYVASGCMWNYIATWVAHSLVAQNRLSGRKDRTPTWFRPHVFTPSSFKPM